MVGGSCRGVERRRRWTSAIYHVSLCGLRTFPMTIQPLNSYLPTRTRQLSGCDGRRRNMPLIQEVPKKEANYNSHEEGLDPTLSHYSSYVYRRKKTELNSN